MGAGTKAEVVGKRVRLSTKGDGAYRRRMDRQQDGGLPFNPRTSRVFTELHQIDMSLELVQSENAENLFSNNFTRKDFRPKLSRVPTIV